MSNNNWVDKEQYPFNSNYLLTDADCGMHYLDEGQGETLLFVHGTPSWSFDFRYQIKGLRKRYRCIAPDHIGFGLSDKPSQYPYSVGKHIDNLEQLVLTLDLQKITLLVHDFGAAIGIGMALRHPERMDKLVILNSWLWNCNGQPDFEKFKRILKNPLLPFLYKYLNFSASILLPGSFGKKKLTRTIRKQYKGPFLKVKDREGPLAFARSLLNEQEFFGVLWSHIHVFSNLPVLLIWGMNDPLIGKNYLDKYLEAFPHAQQVQLEGCGHFPQEEESEAVLENLRIFLDSKQS